MLRLQPGLAGRCLVGKVRILANTACFGVPFMSLWPFCSRSTNLELGEGLSTWLSISYVDGSAQSLRGYPDCCSEGDAQYNEAANEHGPDG